MKSSLRFLLAAGLLTVASIQAAIVRVVEKSFTVQPGGTLHVETSGGEIRVQPTNDNSVKVVARQKIRASSEADADELLKKLDLTIEQTGNDINATAKYEKSAFGFHFGSWPPVSVEFIVTVPANFMADLRTSGGGITVGDLGGKVVARTSGGSIKLGKIGAGVDARTSGGSIDLDTARGPVKLSTSGGHILAGTVNGAADITTSGGGIRIDSVEGLLRAKTSGGSIRAGFTGPLQDDSSLSTSGGSVRVTVDKTAAFRLDAVTSGGSVDAEGLTVTLEKSSRTRSQLCGAVNGGSVLLKLRSSGGDVVVRTR
jgi:hypothetical protein